MSADRLWSRALRLPGDSRGVALVELAYSLPLILVGGLYSAELANFVTVNQRVSSVVSMVADNAARMGSASSLTVKQITESDINDLLLGANEQSGLLALKTNGRIILSSLEQNSSGGQWIHWQRCYGAKTYASTNGVQGDGATGTAFPGMGKGTPKITAPAASAVMFVEVAYTYKPMFPMLYFPSKTIVDSSAFLVRDKRDLTQVYNSGGATISAC